MAKPKEKINDNIEKKVTKKDFSLFKVLFFREEEMVLPKLLQFVR